LCSRINSDDVHFVYNLRRVLTVKNVRADKIIEKFGLRQVRTIHGNLGQKMEESCIRKFVEGDPSGTAKYLEWMLYQAGGGKSKLDRSVKQWNEGEHGEPSLKEQLRNLFVTSRMGHWTDDDGNQMMPVPKHLAEAEWDREEKRMMDYHVYGDEEYVEQGCFGFYRCWPGANECYALIVDAVRRFHKHSAALRAKGHSTDLSMVNYPDLADLQVVLKDVTAAELKADVDYDVVYSDEWIQVFCPYNIGASLKLGHDKWCTANESMFLQALSGDGKNRWKEYASISALYYCHFKDVPEGVATKHVAIQVVFTGEDVPNASPKMLVAYAKYWDTEDKSHSLEEFLKEVGKCAAMRLQHLNSFNWAILAVVKHYSEFNRKRIVLNLST